MADNSGFKFVFPENLKRADASLTTTDKLSFSDIEEFVEDRQKIRRALEKSSETELRVDYSEFSSHVFFDSAISKFAIAQDRVLNKFPFNGTTEEKESFHLTGSGYEEYVFNSWPRYVGYADFNGDDQYVSASDPDSNLYIGSSSIMVSCWVDPGGITSDQNSVVEFMSGTASNYFGYSLGFVDSSGYKLVGEIYSGSAGDVSLSADYTDYVGSFNHVALIYDRTQNSASILINGVIADESTLNIGPIEFKTDKFLIASSSIASSVLYSGSVDEVRVCHTGSVAWLQKNYNRPISALPYNTGTFEESESHLRLYYKFNEGVTTQDSYDKIIVDYSKSGIHGAYEGYASDSRVSGAVMLTHEGDPILYNFHPEVISFTGSMVTSASFYDNENNNNIFNLIPEAIIREDDDAEGIMSAFSLSLARFFDELKLYIDQFGNLRITNYDGYDETPDLFLPYLQRYFGWKATEHYGDADVSAFFYGENVASSGSLDVPLNEIRNQFWRRTLNNLPYLLKTKGKRHNLDAFFNVMGINRENISIKEYGYLPGGSIEDTRIHKQKVVSLLGIGTGSYGTLSSSYVKTDHFWDYTNKGFTVESTCQFVSVSSSYSGSLLTGSIWTAHTGSDNDEIGLFWARESLSSSYGKLFMSSSNSAGAYFETDSVELFKGDILHVSVTRPDGAAPATTNINIRSLEGEGDRLTLSSSYNGSIGGATGSYSFIMGAASGSVWETETQGFYGEYRVWDRILSASELDDHAMHFESVGIRDPNESPHPLLAHFPLNENITASLDVVDPILELSRRNLTATTGARFPASENPYQKFYLDYNYLSPSIDLKWTENKIRIRNKSELKVSELAHDTNEVALEFNLVDALNEDISKIFSTMDIANNVIGSPVNKYREDYSDLENLRRKYFERLGDSINFTNFFKLFRWFDRRLSDSIMQLLPARVRFIGGEHVVESHFLERPKYGYKYPVFRTPPTIPETVISASANLEGHSQYVFTTELSGVLEPDGTISPQMKTHFADGLEKSNSQTVFAIKVSGDQKDEVNESGVSVNNKNEFAKLLLMRKDRDNE